MWSRRASLVGRFVITVALPLGLAVACGSSSPPPAAQTPAPAVGGGPPSLPVGAEAAAPMLDSVTKAVPGLTSSQAATGTGSLLGLAQAKMPTEQFALVAGAVPGTDALIGGAQKQGLPSSSELTSLSSLHGVFDKAGIAPTQVSQMIPVLGKTVSKGAGPQVEQAFLAALR